MYIQMDVIPQQNGLELSNATVAAKPRAPAPVIHTQAMAGLVVALVTLVQMLSYTALLFGTTPPDVQAQGLVMMLLSVILMAGVGAMLSTLPSSFLSHDGALIAVMAPAVAALAAGLAGAPPGVLGATVMAGLALTAIVTGLALLGLGWTRGGAVVRFLPLQVTAGMGSAAGWSLLMGGASVAIAHPVSLAALPTQAELLHMLPAVVWAALILVATRRFRSPLVLPSMVLAGVGLHHGVFAVLGRTLDQQRLEHWLLPATGRLTPTIPWSPEMLWHIDWSALASQLPALGATVAVACLLLTVNVNLLEIGTQQDVDVDRDLRANGAAAVLSGLAGGVMGIMSAVRSAQLYRLGSRSRLTPLFTGLAVGVVPMALPDIFGLVPRAVLGALLLTIGFNTLENWLVKIRRRLSLAEWLTIPAVLLVSVWFGLPAAVFIGLVLGCATFAVMYSLASPIRARYRGDVAQSNVVRSPAERAVLLDHADAVLVLYLQGFLFFGTASRLLQEIKAEIARYHGVLRHLVLDCSNIDGLDGSARATFDRMRQIAIANGITLTYAALTPAAAKLLGLSAGNTGATPTLDEALERSETDLLAGHVLSPAPVLTFLAGELDDPADAAALNAALVPSLVPQGSTLMAQGEASEDLVFLASGQAIVTITFDGGPEVRVRQFGPGTMIGEIGFLLGCPRTATVRAMTDCEVWILTRAAMQRLETERPGAALALQRTVMAGLSTRLLDKDHLIAALTRGTRHTA